MAAQVFRSTERAKTPSVATSAVQKTLRPAPEFWISRDRASNDSSSPVPGMLSPYTGIDRTANDFPLLNAGVEVPSRLSVRVLAMSRTYLVSSLGDYIE